MEKNLEFDWVVVGAGTFGLSTTFFLSKYYPNARIALVQQFQIGHDQGSSHSEIRIIRSTYKEELYRDLCVSAIDNYWPELQSDLQEQFLAKNGFITMVENTHAFESFQKVANSSQGQLQVKTQQEILKLFPKVPKLQNKNPIFLDTKSGIVFAEKYIKALTNHLRKKSNVTIFENHSLKSIENSGEKVRMKVQKKGENVEKDVVGKKVMLSCGRWISSLVPDLKKITTVAKQSVGFFKPKSREGYKIGQYPSWVHELPNGDEWYGLPDASGVGIKLAKHSKDSSLEFSFKSQAEFLQFRKQEMIEAARLYIGECELNKIEGCYYTNSKTDDFILDWSDERENVLVCSTCSGHGFKFSPIIGKIASDLLVKDTSDQVFENSRHFFRIPYHLGINLQ